MAVRTISTKLAVDGEAEYKQKIASCNSELRTLKSSLALVESEYKNNANSMEALTAKGTTLGSLYEKQKEKVSSLEQALQNCQRAQEEYTARVTTAKDNIERCERALEELKQSTEDTSEEQAALTEELGKWNAELEEAQAGQAAAERGVQNWQQQLNKAKIEQNELSEAVKKNGQYLEEAQKSTDGCATSIDQYGKEAKNAGDESEKFGGKSKDAINQLAGALAAAGVAKGLKEIAEALKACVDASIEFESAIAGVFKTVDGTDEQLAAISDGIKKMATEIPATTTEIAAVAEAAGQLGIKTEDVLSFTRTMIDLGESTNLSADEAASALAKFANITGTAAEDYSRLGSVVVGLGNNFATTEADIVAMSTRLASAGTLAGLSEAQIMALAAAMSSVGIEAEAGGTAMTQTLSAIESAVAEGEESLEQFAKIAGVSSAEFASAWENNAISAIQLFITGLGELDAKGESATLVLDKLGLSGIRQSNMLKSLALASDQLAGAVSLANEEWAKNSALTEEAEKRYSTTESRLKMCENAANNLKVAIGDALAPALRKLADTGTSAFQWAADFIDENPWLVEAITAVTVGLGTLAAGLTLAANAANIAKVAQAALNAVMSANPFGLVAAGVAAAAAALTTLCISMDDGTTSVKELTGAAREMETVMEDAKTACDDTVTSTLAAAGVADTYISKLEEMGDYASLSTEKQREYHNILALLCETVPELANYIDLETNTIEGGTEALRANTEAWKENAVAQAYQEEYTQLVSAYADVLLEAEKNSIGLTAAQGELEAAQQKYNDALDRMSQLSDEATDAAKAYNEENLTAIDSTSFLSQEYYTLRDSLSELANAVADAEQKVDTYNEAIKEGEEAAKAAEEEIALAEEAIRNLTTAQEEAVGPTQEMTDTVSGLISEMEALQASYEESYSLALQSLEGQIGLFQELDGSAQTSIDNLIKTLEGQVEYMNTYAANIQKAMELGVDEGLIKKLSDGSEESAQILAAIVEGGEEDIAALNEQLAKVEEGKANFAGTVAEMETDFDKKMTDIENRMETAMEVMNAYTEAKSAGRNTILGYIDGANSMLPSLRSTYQSLAKAANNAYKSTLDIHSPSRVFRDDGKNSIRGAIEGGEEMRGDLERTYGSLAESALKAYEKAQPSRSDFLAIQRDQAASSAEAYERAANAALESVRRSIPSTVEEPRQSGTGDAVTISAALERFGAAVCNQGGGGEVIKIVVPITLDRDVIGEAVTEYQLQKARSDGK